MITWMRMQFEDFVDYVEVVASLHSWHTMLCSRGEDWWSSVHHMLLASIPLCGLEWLYYAPLWRVDGQCPSHDWNGWWPIVHHMIEFGTTCMFSMKLHFILNGIACVWADCWLMYVFYWEYYDDVVVVLLVFILLYLL